MKVPYKLERFELVHEHIIDEKRKLVIRVYPSWPCYSEDGAEVVTNINLEVSIEVQTPNYSASFVIEEVRSED